MIVSILHTAFVVIISTISTYTMYAAQAPYYSQDEAKRKAQFMILQSLLPEDQHAKFHANPFGDVVLPLEDGNFLLASISSDHGYIDLSDSEALYALAKKHAAAWKKAGKGVLFLEENVDAQVKKIFLLNTTTHHSIYCPIIRLAQKNTEVVSLYGSSFPCSNSNRGVSPFNVVALHDSEKRRYYITFLNKRNDSKKIIVYDGCKTLKQLHRGYVYFLAGIFGEIQTHHIYPFSCEVTTTKENLETFMEEIKTKDITAEVKECRGVFTFGMHDPF